MMSNENQIITISGFTGMAIGILLMMIVKSHSEQKLIERHESILESIVEDVYKYELSYEVCEDCWYEVFDGGETY